MKSKICCWRVVSLRSAIRSSLSLARTCVRNSRRAVGRHQVSVQEKSRQSAAFLVKYAPERIRTSTPQLQDQALNLARLPVPPQARGTASLAAVSAAAPQLGYDLLPDFLPPFFPPFFEAALPDPAFAFEIFAARSLDMPFFRRPSYCLSFLTEEP